MNSESLSAARQALAKYGDMDDAAIDLAAAALELAALGHPGITLSRYHNHLRKLQDEVAERYRKLIEAGAENSPETQHAALKHILADKHDYRIDADAPGHIQNADLIRVIDRGAGGAAALGILYICTGRAQGWTLDGLKLPGAFAVRVEKDGQRLMFDPADGCRVLQAPDLRRIVKAVLGPQAELSASYYEAAGNREILIRLQNHIKLRQIESEDYEGALQSVEAMRALDPAEHRLLLDAGVLCARTGRHGDALNVLERYIANAPPGRDREEAAYLLEEIRLALKD